MYLDHGRNRRHSRAIENKKHVVSWRRKIRIGRPGNIQTSGGLLEIHGYVTSVLIEKVRDSSSSDQHDTCDGRAIWSSDEEILTVLNLRGRSTNRWSRAFKKIGRRVEFGIRLIRYLSKICAHT